MLQVALNGVVVLKTGTVAGVPDHGVGEVPWAVSEFLPAPEPMPAYIINIGAPVFAPFAPHVAEELWQRLGNEFSVHTSPWPAVDARFLVDDEVEVPVQVLGKVRARVKVAKDAPEDALVGAAKGAVESWIQGKTLVKTIVVPGKLVNFVVR